MTWHVLTLPLCFDPERADPADRRTVAGDLLTDRITPERVKRLEKQLGPHDSASQLQQDPRVRDGGMVREGWIQHYETARPRTEYERVGLYFDASFGSVKKSADPACAMVIGKIGPDFHVLDLFMRVCDLPAQLVGLAVLVDRWTPDEKVIEAKANGQSILDICRKQSPGWIGFDPRESKEIRFAAITTYFEAGNISFPKSAPWLAEAVNQVLSFPRSGAHDEVPDCLSMGIPRLANSTASTFTANMLDIAKAMNGGPLAARIFAPLGGLR